MSETTIIFPENAVSTPGFDRFESMVTAKDVWSRYLHGVDVRDNTGDELSEKTTEFAIDAAISLLEHDLEMTITPTAYAEDHDYKMEDYWNWGFLQMQHKPIISVESFELTIDPANANIRYPNDWVRIQRMAGQLQVAPISGAVGAFNIGNMSFLPRLLMFNSTFPNFFHVNYTAGFEQNKMPKLITQAIGILAALDILNIAGDLVLGAGIAATSIGIDGLSQSITSTASAENTAYGARIKLYQAQMKKIMGVLRKYYGKTVKHTVC